MPTSKKTNTLTSSQYATLWQRFSAYQVDSLLFTLPWIVALWFISRESDPMRMAAVSIEQFTWVIFPSILASFVYAPYCTYRWGATLGKAVVGIRVADKQNKLLTLNQAAFRELILKALSAAPLGFGWWVAKKHPQRQAWHDELAGSYVYQTESRTWLGVAIWLGGWVLLGWIFFTFGVQIFSGLADTLRG